jgi:hypothetical protein
LNFVGADAVVGCTDDSDQEVEQQDNVEEAADEENDPVAITVEL